MKTAIIGLGNIGTRVARNLAKGGVNLLLADSTQTKADNLARELGGHVSAMPIADAIEKADVIIFAVWLDGIKELFQEYRSSLAGKIIVDPSNPIVPDGKGGFAKNIPADQSSGKILRQLLPVDAELVKAFGTLGAESLTSGVNRTPDHAVLFYASDYPEAGRTVAKLITASGFSPISIGGIDQSIRIEVGGDLHEFGKLGRLVSANEAAMLV